MRTGNNCGKSIDERNSHIPPIGNAEIDVSSKPESLVSNDNCDASETNVEA